MPYTPSDEIASVNRKPTGSGATAMSIRPHGVGSDVTGGLDPVATEPVRGDHVLGQIVDLGHA